MSGVLALACKLLVNGRAKFAGLPFDADRSRQSHRRRHDLLAIGIRVRIQLEAVAPYARVDGARRASTRTGGEHGLHRCDS
jgi:hypothetical protein